MASSENSVHLDDVLKTFGPFNRYNVRAILLLSFVFFNNNMHCINYIIVAEETPYRCKIDTCESQTKVFQPPWYNFTVPQDSRGCNRYSSVSEECSESSFNASHVETCDEWVYKRDDSFVAEFNLGCQDWKRTLVGTIHSIGLMSGLFFQGQLSDKIGRKAAIMIAGVSASVFGVGKSYANSYSAFVILEWFEATFGDNCLPAYILGVELMHGDYRLHQQIFFCGVAALGGVAFAIAAYLVPYWRHFARVIYAPSLLFILYYFILDESVRWLLSKGKREDATTLLLKMAKVNKIALDEKMLVNIKCEDNAAESSPLRETFRSKIVIKRFLICLVWWTSCTFIAFGLIVNVGYLAGNKYLNLGIMSLTDIPASITMVFVLKRFKRKKPLFTSFMSAGLMCLIQPFVPKEYVWMSTGLYFVGRFITTFTFATVYIYTSELFPTYSRNSMHALCSSIGRIGSILAPMTPLLTRYMDSLPTLLFGTISIVAGLTTMLVPDPASEPLPDNVRQAESIGTYQLRTMPDKKTEGNSKT
ncbi:organic cation transporter protein-like [Maniola jurtina]|uniref:organic cation transporter protein-like n=1 Tax=Maniola jurtina TaxID=191418 RepID=UPI001E68D1D1|nr:organic cation transporter protein-like [Maniola jurtina]XP_045764031.1 organic cation transporter protein-like [Maniola jurtina]